MTHQLLAEPLDTSTARVRRQLALLLGLACLYVCFFLVYRWIRLPLFQPQPLSIATASYLESWRFEALRALPSDALQLYLIWMSCLPVALWAIAIYVVAHRWPRVLNPAALAGLIFVAIVVIELDLGWYGMSGRHATLREAFLAVSEDLQDWGLGPSQTWEFRRRVAGHAAVLASLWLLSGALARLAWVSFSKVSARFVAASLAVPFLISVLGAGYAFSRDKSQWIEVSTRNPLRPTVLDYAAESLFRGSLDLDTANEALAASRRVTPPPPRRVTDLVRTSLSARLDNVLVITVEGFNHSLVDSETMPFWTALSRQSLILTNHYTTGNVSEYGILGLLHGSPVTFIEPTTTLPTHELPAWHLTERGPQSLYVDAFNRHGYQTRIITTKLSTWANLPSYLRNFSRPWFETRVDAELIPVMQEELSRPGGHLVYTHYLATHLPYTHRSAFSLFRPEVPEDFNYLSWDMQNAREGIRNRYRNCLRELDDWLRTLVGKVDMARTIIVVTGDHGEEFFENGRLGHASALDEPQIKTPFLMYVPGMAGKTIDDITSHADVMPTLMDLLGWSDEVSGFARSIFRFIPVRSAIVAAVNRPNRPERWAVITRDAKAIVNGQSGDPLRVMALYEGGDRPAVYRSDPARWQANFCEVVRFERQLAGGADGRFLEVRASENVERSASK